MSFYLLEHAVNNGTQWQQWGLPSWRGTKLSGTCIIHTSESVLDIIGPDSTAEDCAAFIGRRTGDYGSYHDLVDSDSIIEMVPFEYAAWQDSQTNPWAVGLSCACKTSDWATMGVEKEERFLRNLAICAADFVVYMKAAYNITVPLKRISGEQARNREPGFCAHGDSGIGRTDPGVNFKWDKFFQFTQEVLDGKENKVTPEQFAALEKLIKDNGVYGMFENAYGHIVNSTTVLSAVDKNVQDLKEPTLIISAENLQVLADGLKKDLGASVAAHLAKLLSAE